MTHQVVNFDIHQDRDKLLNFSVVDQQIPAVVVDLTGSTLSFAFSSKVSPFTALFTKTVGSGLTITNATGGLFSVQIDKADVATLVGEHRYEVKMLDPAGKEDTIVEGTIVVSSSIH